MRPSCAEARQERFRIRIREIHGRISRALAGTVSDREPIPDRSGIISRAVPVRARDCRGSRPCGAGISLAQRPAAMHKGFEGIVRGLGDLLQVASDVAERADRGAADGMFGVSVRVGRSSVMSDVVADLFDEDDHYLIVAELPGVAESAVHWSIRANTVVIRATAAGRSCGKDIPLATRVDGSTAVARYGNGVLELRVWKQQPR